MCSALSAMNCDIITGGGPGLLEPQMKHGRKSAAERTMAPMMVSSSSRLSVNPARSTGPALFAGSPYIARLWLFWLVPILGAAIAGVVTRRHPGLPDAD
jgi:hypothetical protein